MNYKLIKPDQKANTAKFTGEINVWSVEGNVKPTTDLQVKVRLRWFGGRFAVHMRTCSCPIVF